MQNMERRKDGADGKNQADGCRCAGQSVRFNHVWLDYTLTLRIGYLKKRNDRLKKEARTDTLINGTVATS